MLLFQFNNENLYEADQFLGSVVFRLFIVKLLIMVCYTQHKNKSTKNQDQDACSFIYIR